jgi:hypothetical protein
VVVRSTSRRQEKEEGRIPFVAFAHGVKRRSRAERTITAQQVFARIRGSRAP